MSKGKRLPVVVEHCSDCLHYATSGLPGHFRELCEYPGARRELSDYGDDAVARIPAWCPLEDA